MGLLTRLIELNLSLNNLTGTIPTQIGALTALTSLILGGDRGLDGTLPSEIGCLTKLKHLHIFNCSLVGTIPSQIGLLTALTSLNVRDNSFTGNFIPSMEALARKEKSEPQHFLINCDMSGLQSKTKACKRDCIPCDFFAIQIKPCDSEGYDQQCLPAYLLLPLVVVYIGLVVVALKRISPLRVSRHKLIVAALMSSLAIGTLAANLAFAINLISKPSEGDTRDHRSNVIKTIGYVSFCVLGVTALMNFVFSILVINRIVTELDGVGRFVNMEFRDRIFNNVTLLALTTTFCALSLRILPFMIGNQYRTIIVKRPAFNLSCRQLQEQSNRTMNGNNISNKSNDNHNIKINNDNLHHTSDCQQILQPQPQSQFEPVGMNLVNLVGWLNVFESVPQSCLQIAALAVGESGLVVVFALLLSMFSIVSEAFVARTVRYFFSRKSQKFHQHNRPQSVEASSVVHVASVTA
eukprot:c12297_g1_i3.p1 GENE.c12297_g1_i3~~c12297_g1_i3.p1  ORF type:complete len:465 (-),score=86.17 c12297_g1_i3:223-1617(-)